MKNRINNLVEKAVLTLSFTALYSVLPALAINLTASDLVSDLKVDSSLNTIGTTKPNNLAEENSFSLRHLEPNAGNSNSDFSTLNFVLDGSTELENMIADTEVTNLGFGEADSASVDFFQNSNTSATQKNSSEIDICVFTVGCQSGRSTALSPFPVKFEGDSEFVDFENIIETKIFADTNIAEIPEPRTIFALGLFAVGSLMTSKKRQQSRIN